MLTLPMIQTFGQEILLTISKNCFFGATSVIKNSDKEKFEYSGYRITLNVADIWDFDNEFSRNFIIFGVDNS